MGYSSEIKKQEILLFDTTWMKLEGVTVNEMCQTKTNTVWYQLYAETKKESQSHRKNGCRIWGVGEIGRYRSRIQNFSYKINTS